MWESVSLLKNITLHSDNDVAMIEYAHIGIAVANAMEVLKEKADYITKSNDEDGPAIVLKKILEK